MTKSVLRRIRDTLGGETTLQGAINAMGKEREEQILEQLASFSDQVVVIVEKLEDMVQRFAADSYAEVEASAKEMDRLESEADTKKELILDRLSLRGVFPMNRADLARLVGSMDIIANLSSGAADRIAMRRFSLPAQMNELLLALARADTEMVRTLRDAVAAIRRDLHRALETATSIDKMESKADDLYAELYREMFEWDIDYKTFHQFTSIIERLESIADRCSQNAEAVRHMALEYLETG
jgi:uncharacterized protein